MPLRRAFDQLRGDRAFTVERAAGLLDRKGFGAAHATQRVNLRITHLRMRNGHKHTWCRQILILELNDYVISM